MTTLAVHPMTTLPIKSDRYPVLHSGRVAGHAWYWTPEDAADDVNFSGVRVAGWQQLPSFGPTHWIDTSTWSAIYTDGHTQFWSDKNGFPSDKPYREPPKQPVKKSLFKRIFTW